METERPTPEQIADAMRIVRATRTREDIVNAARNAAAKRKGRPLSPDHKAALSKAQTERRERERAERPEPQLDPVHKRPRGRPKKVTAAQSGS
jgi:transcriptional regulator with AAA-type ATPase domain